jgi:hypothetical protein
MASTVSLSHSVGDVVLFNLVSVVAIVVGACRTFRTQVKTVDLVVISSLVEFGGRGCYVVVDE